MPPKARFSAAEVVDAAFDLVREEGDDALTARSLALRLGSSSQPIFTVFASMDDLRGAVMSRARALYDDYVRVGLSARQAFRGVGVQYVRFATEQPKLFQLLFMREQVNIPEISGVLPLIDDNYSAILDSILAEYPVDQETAANLYQHLWVYTHGIATLAATGMCRFAPEETGRMMTEVFLGLLSQASWEDSGD